MAWPSSQGDWGWVQWDVVDFGPFMVMSWDLTKKHGDFGLKQMGLEQKKQ